MTRTQYVVEWPDATGTIHTQTLDDAALAAAFVDGLRAAGAAEAHIAHTSSVKIAHVSPQPLHLLVGGPWSGRIVQLGPRGLLLSDRGDKGEPIGVLYRPHRIPIGRRLYRLGSLDPRTPISNAVDIILQLSPADLAKIQEHTS